MIPIRVLTEEDFPFAVFLTDTVTWGFTEEDFRYMVNLEPDGCFIVLDDKERIGITTTITYGKVGWIGNVIVDENYRNRGVGSVLLKHAVNFLRERSVKTINLLSYVHAVPFYERLGFRSVTGFAVLKGRNIHRGVVGEARRAEEKDFHDILTFDTYCFGASRERLLKDILSEKDNFCYVSYEDDGLSGFAFARRYSEMSELGPMACRSAFDDSAISLLYAVLGELTGLEVHMNIAERAESLLSELGTLGFEKCFRVVKMFWGEPTPVRSCLLAAESLERG